MQERLQKILAHAGVASRRKAERMIQEGQVSVNGRLVTELGSKADPAKDIIKVDGKRIRLAERPVYILLNKPRNVMSTTSDPQGRPTALDLVRPGVRERIYPVGRLDFASEGLLLLTNDGEFARFMTRAGVVEKVYHVKVSGQPSDREIARLERGIHLDGKKLAPSRIRLFKPGPNPWYEVALCQGRNQQIRRIFLAIGHPVEKLRRVRIGFLNDPRLAPGKWRYLTDREVGRLYDEFSAGRTS